MELFILPRTTAIFVDDAEAVLNVVGAGVFRLLVVDGASSHTVVVAGQRAVVEIVGAYGDRQHLGNGEQRERQQQQRKGRLHFVRLSIIRPLDSGAIYANHAIRPL